ncbi:MAG TPA: hypothetical protein DDW76_34710 [Cyanobacteria bacterium UBA11369]|nr:hypothetical protein [Cyanobacteria bacterium UBA11371]HBE34705.1 hypothetical protein [Cyanobacteria bacterium UBA11368]HBE53764.1 hypothetical protein [Cyanobacteria bacterium UBA11369]
MNRQFLVTVIGPSAIASILTAAIAQPSHAQNRIIECVTADTQPTTRITTLFNNGEQEVLELYWYKKFGTESRQMCQQTTAQMQRYTENGRQFYINRGQIREKFVLCLVRNANDSCRIDRARDFLFPPRTENNPNEFLSAFFKSFTIKPIDRTGTSGEGSIFPSFPNRRPSLLRFFLP